MPAKPFSLEEAARGLEVHDLAEPLPVHAWFKLPEMLIRRSDAKAYRLTRDAVWVGEGCIETELSAWLWRSLVKHRGKAR